MKDKFKQLTLNCSKYEHLKAEIIEELQTKMPFIQNHPIMIFYSTNHGQILKVGGYAAPLISVIQFLENNQTMAFEQFKGIANL